LAEGIKLLEQALSVDPLAEWTRRLLVRAYLDAGEHLAAQSVVDEAQHRLVVRQIPPYLYSHDWKRAGEAAYTAAETESELALDEPMIAGAIRLHARATGDYARAIDALERLSGVTWNANGRATLPDSLDLKAFPTGLADVLRASGDEVRARSVVQATLAAMDKESKEFRRGDLWYLQHRPIVLALLGESDAAIEALRSAVARGIGKEDVWYYFHIEPAFAALRSDPRFLQLHDDVRTHTRAQKQRLAELRSAGFVPERP
jgi:tetratricopeptide (TPR) repeat protein